MSRLTIGTRSEATSRKWNDLNELILAKVRDGIALVVQKETLNAISLDLADRKIGSKQAPFLASLLPTTPLLEVLDLSALDLDDEDLAKVYNDAHLLRN